MSLLTIFDSAYKSLQSIFRNKRRSTAMLAGIILGVSMLSGIIIYYGILQADNFDSIVGTAEYEVSFKLIEDIDDEIDLWKVGHMIENDPRVEDYTVIIGPETENLFSQEREFFTLKISTEIEINNLEENELTEFTPQFIRENFTSTTIYDRIAGREIKGSFDITGTDVNKTVIPKAIADKFNIKIGDIIDQINFTVIEIPNSVFQNSGPRDHADLSGEREKLIMKNVVVTGIYNAPIADAGFFSNFQASKFYFNSELLNLFGQDINPIINSNRNFILAVKLNTNEFTISDVDLLDEEIDTFINDVSLMSVDAATGDDIVVGTNIVEVLLLPFEFLNLFLVIFDIILILPIVLLCLYLLIFGLQLSLEERKKEIAIFKVQGANSGQIFRLIRNEGLVLFLIGASVGYLASILGAWIIASTTQFLVFNITSINEFMEFLTFDIVALSVSVSIIFIILIITIYKKGREFINLEVTKGIQRAATNQPNFFVRNGLDLFMVGYGLLSALIIILNEETLLFQTLDWDPTTTLWTVLFRVVGTIFLWVGAAVSGARVAKYIPNKSEQIFLNLPKLRHVGLIIRSGLKRRGDIDKLVLIIVLTLSVTTLAGIQGGTDLNVNIEELEYEIGSDFKVTFASIGNFTDDLASIEGISEVMEIPFFPTSILSQNSLIYGMDQNIADKFIWHDEGFNYKSKEDVLSDFRITENLPEIMLGIGIARSLRAQVGDEFNLKVIVADPLANTSNVARVKTRVIGIFDHAPGAIDSDSIVGSHDLIIQLADLIGESFGLNIVEIPSNSYLLKAQEGFDKNKIEQSLIQLEGYSRIRNLEREISEIGSENTYGIPGLLTMMYGTSLLAVLLSAFAFSAIIMERRKREFAVLQTIGASSQQIYLVAFGENFLVMITSVLYGTMSGIGLSYLMNGFFNFINELLSITTIPRNVLIQWDILLINVLLVLGGMIIASLLSVRSSVRQDLTEATRIV